MLFKIIFKIIVYPNSKLKLLVVFFRGVESAAEQYVAELAAPAEHSAAQPRPATPNAAPGAPGGPFQRVLQQQQLVGVGPVCEQGIRLAAQPQDPPVLGKDQLLILAFCRN